MAVSLLQLVKRTDGGADIDSVDLMSLPIELQYDGWRQATPTQQGQDSVDDVITLLMNAGNDNALATALQSIDTKVKQTQWAQDPLNPVGVWLRSRLGTESNARQSFIKELRRSELSTTDPLAYNSILREYQLGVTRMPVWENISPSTIGGNSINANGATISYTIGGDAHARVANVRAVGDGGVFYEMWLGAKSDRYGVNPANFNPVLSVTSNANYPDTTTSADGTALSGSKNITDFANYEAMADRGVAFIGSNPADQRGKYTVLLRAKVASSLKVNVRAGMGNIVTSAVAPYAYAASYMPRLQIYNSGISANWYYYPLGIIKIPAVDGFSTQALTYSSVTIAAEKVSGAGNFETDSIILIPAEHNIHVRFNHVGFSGTDPGDGSAYILTRPDNKSYSIIYSTYIKEVSPPDAMNWSLPSGSGVIVCVAQDIDHSESTDTITPTLTVYPSYSSLRGTA